MEMFRFRIVRTGDVDVFDTSMSTPYSSLTPVQMQEYMEADVQLHYMEIQKRKEQREVKENTVGIKRILKVLLGV